MGLDTGESGSMEKVAILQHFYHLSFSYQDGQQLIFLYRGRRAIGSKQKQFLAVHQKLYSIHMIRSACFISCVSWPDGAQHVLQQFKAVAASGS